ncbi:hypothetical protein [Nocardia sp. NPDC060249]|uniref:hypothetical protein n=1 Tax=Nocardia sp. NPDC060249 TaxID=3347082 RepID=UPI00364EF746
MCRHAHHLDTSGTPFHTRPRSVTLLGDAAHLAPPTLDLCIADSAPFGLADFMTGVR